MANMLSSTKYTCKHIHANAYTPFIHLFKGTRENNLYLICKICRALWVFDFLYSYCDECAAPIVSNVFGGFRMRCSKLKWCARWSCWMCYTFAVLLFRCSIPKFVRVTISRRCDWRRNNCDINMALSRHKDNDNQTTVDDKHRENDKNRKGGRVRGKTINFASILSNNFHLLIATPPPPPFRSAIRKTVCWLKMRQF